MNNSRAPVNQATLVLYLLGILLRSIQRGNWAMRSTVNGFYDSMLFIRPSEAKTLSVVPNSKSDKRWRKRDSHLSRLL